MDDLRLAGHGLYHIQLIGQFPSGSYSAEVLSLIEEYGNWASVT
jgi:hypothetical protein